MKDTGIYIEPDRVPLDSPDKLRSWFAGAGDYNDLSKRLDADEQLARECLTFHGFPDWPLILALPADADPQAGDAQKMLQRVLWLRDLWAKPELSRDDLEWFAILCHEWGQYRERIGVRPFERHALRGRKVLHGAKAGHAGTHGDAKDRADRKARVMADWERLRAKHPERTITGIDRLVAEMHDLSDRTVRSYRTS